MEVGRDDDHIKAEPPFCIACQTEVQGDVNYNSWRLLRSLSTQDNGCPAACPTGACPTVLATGCDNSPMVSWAWMGDVISDGSLRPCLFADKTRNTYDFPSARSKTAYLGDLTAVWAFSRCQVPLPTTDCKDRGLCQGLSSPMCIEGLLRSSSQITL